MNQVRLAIAGATGRMGLELIQASLADPRYELALLLDQQPSPSHPACPHLPVGTDLARLAEVDVLIDFTRAQAVPRHALACVEHRVAWVLGTTGMDAEQQQALRAASEHIAVMASGNMSRAVHVMLWLAKQAARLLPDYDAEIMEAHHRHKVDAPSGTAVMLGQQVAAARQVALEQVAVWQRQGHTGARRSGDIGFAVSRGGSIVGEHTLLLAGEGEQLEISHRSLSRAHYAAGALAAALFVAQQQPGLYDMSDVLNLDA